MHNDNVLSFHFVKDRLRNWYIKLLLIFSKKQLSKRIIQEIHVQRVRTNGLSSLYFVCLIITSFYVSISFSKLVGKNRHHGYVLYWMSPKRPSLPCHMMSHSHHVPLPCISSTCSIVYFKTPTKKHGQF